MGATHGSRLVPNKMRQILRPYTKPALQGTMCREAPRDAPGVKLAQRVSCGRGCCCLGPWLIEKRCRVGAAVRAR